MNVVVCFCSFFFLVFTGCTAKKTVVDQDMNEIIRCSSIMENDFSEMTDTKALYRQGDTEYSLTQVRYHCGSYAYLISKAMYDRFGKWNNKAATPDGQFAVFTWQGLPLQGNTGDMFTVFSTGYEGNGIYTAVSVVDRWGNDVLEENHPARADLINYFAAAIRANDNSKTRFFGLAK